MGLPVTSLRISGASARIAAVFAVIAAAAGCTSTAVLQSSATYYGQGPSEALETLHGAQVRPADIHLAAMERAVALQELGEYEKSNAELLACARGLGASRPDAASAVLSLVVNDEAGVYRGESFEQVYLHTMAMTNFLALQDVGSAAREAQQALAAIAAAGCPACRFPFTRYLAAISLDLCGRTQEAVDALAEAVAESPENGFLAAELDRLAGSGEGAEALAFAPPPLGDPDGRELLIVLLLGKGPAKVQDTVFVPPSHGIAWPRYVPRYPKVTTRASLRAAGMPEVGSVELTDMEELAATGLKARLSGLIAKEVVKTVGHEVVVHNLEEDGHWGLALLARALFSLADRADLRHWSTLPASCQVLRATIPEGVVEAELRYLAPSGAEVDREILLLPAEWTLGPLFVTRRMP